MANTSTHMHKKCPHCGGELSASLLPNYSYTCLACDEDFYECEVGE